MLWVGAEVDTVLGMARVTGIERGLLGTLVVCESLECGHIFVCLPCEVES